MLGYGIFFETLLKQNRINYGINGKRKTKSTISIPFTGSDTPSSRSEFSQNDYVIVLTALSFYEDGLLLEDIKHITQILLSLGDYNNWFDLIKNKEEYKIINKLDSSSNECLEMMLKAYKYNKECINFYLDKYIFPK